MTRIESTTFLAGVLLGSAVGAIIGLPPPRKLDAVHGDSPPPPTPRTSSRR